jgi:hypothetical protein
MLKNILGAVCHYPVCVPLLPLELSNQGTIPYRNNQLELGELLSTIFKQRRDLAM